MTVNLKNFLNPKVKMSKMGEFQELQPIEGLEVSSISADLYGDGRDDLCLFYFKEGANLIKLIIMELSFLRLVVVHFNYSLYLSCR